MMRRNWIVGIIMIVTASCTTAQPGYYTTSDKKARKFMEKAEECMAISADKLFPDIDCGIQNIESALARDANMASAWVRLGELYEMKNDFKKAIECNIKGLEVDPKISPTGYLYFITARLAIKIGDYETCAKYAGKYMVVRNNNPDLHNDCELYLEHCRFAKQAMANPVKFDPKNVGPGINTVNHEYFPAITGDDQQMLFTRLIPDDRISKALGGKQEDFYVSEWVDGKWSKGYGISSRINSKFNEGAPTLSSDGRVLIFTACELMDMGFGENREGIGSCDLFFSFKVGDQWSMPDNFGKPLNSWHWESQPSFSADGKTLYFVRGIREKRAGRNKQKQDIYFSEYDDKTGWSVPEKLGPQINTPYREESVYIHPDGQTLYFSSAGHPGMGGLDLYLSRKQPDGTWGPAVNLGYPINTYNDENSLLVSSAGEIAYFASDREGGYGGLDIYGFELPLPNRPIFTTYMKGKVYDKVTKDPLRAAFKLIDIASGDTIVSSNSDQVSGEFLVSIPYNKRYLLLAEKEGYVYYSEAFELTETRSGKPFEKDVPLIPMGNVSDESITLEGVYFDTDKDVLKPESRVALDRFYAYLMDHEEIRVELGGHTDSIGDDAYNKDLSDRRAKAVLEYLVKKGVERSRMEAKGYGEEQPIETNSTVEGRARNRRTAYKIL